MKPCRHGCPSGQQYSGDAVVLGGISRVVARLSGLQRVTVSADDLVVGGARWGDLPAGSASLEGRDCWLRDGGLPAAAARQLVLPLPRWPDDRLFPQSFACVQLFPHFW